MVLIQTRKLLLFALTSLVIFCATCAKPASDAPQPPDAAPASRSGKLRIGFSMDTLKEERWQKDRDLFVARAEELGAEVLVQAANGDDALQNSQAENLLTQGVDVLLVAPHNGKTAAII